MNTTHFAVLVVFAAYWLLILVLKRRGVLERYNITNYGPILMIRTERGQGLLESLASPRTMWRAFADIGLPLMVIGILAMFLMILSIDVFMVEHAIKGTMPPPTEANAPRNILLIPGINEFIPLVWGLLGLITCLFVHEMGHAVLCRVEGIKVKSMGILYALIPLGAFAEPDEEELFGGEDGARKIEMRRKRMRVLTAGVTGNFVVALIAFSLFFGPVLGAIEPVGGDGVVMVTSVESGGPADLAGLKEETIITHVNGEEIHSGNDYTRIMSNVKGGDQIIMLDKEGNEYTITAQDPSEKGWMGIVVSQNMEVLAVQDEFPAAEAGLAKGMKILTVGGVSVPNMDAFIEYMGTTRPGQALDVVAETDEGRQIFTVHLTEAPADIGATVGEFNAEGFLRAIDMIPSTLTSLYGWIFLGALPIYGFRGFSDVLMNFYMPVGWAESFGPGVFYLANSLFWIGWINFYVGLFNCMPAVPLDGGHVFRDIIESTLGRFLKNMKEVEEFAGVITTYLALLMLASIVLMIVGPYVL